MGRSLLSVTTKQSADNDREEVVKVNISFFANRLLHAGINVLKIGVNKVIIIYVDFLKTKLIFQSKNRTKYN